MFNEDLFVIMNLINNKQYIIESYFYSDRLIFNIRILINTIFNY